MPTFQTIKRVAAGLCLSIGAAHVNTGAQSPLRVTVIGCVRPSSPASSTVAAAVVPVEETKYVLSNITLAADDASVKSDTPAVQPGQALAAAVKSYRLDDSTHPLPPTLVGKRVEISGTVVPSAHASSPPLLRVERLQEVAVSANSTACLE